MKQLNSIDALAALALTAGTLAALPAQAHISVDMGGTHKSRYSDDGLKDSPCGMMGGSRGTNIYTYKPGATINVAIAETISHPGYFRISFDSDGDDGFVIPSGTNGESGDCGGDAKCGAGKEDFCNSDTVLLDDLDPHASAGFGGTAKKYTWSVKLPDIECANCTLQILQVMNDLNFHPTPYPGDDIYYQCIDIVLSKDAPDVTTTPVMNKGMVCKGGSAPGTGSQAGATGASGAGGAGSTGGANAIAGSGAAGASVAAAGGGSGAGAAASAAGGASGVASSLTAGASGSAGSRAPSVGTMSMSSTAAGSGGAPSLTAGASSPATTAGSSATSTPTATPASGGGDSGGCSVATAGLPNGGGAAGWLLLLAAFAFARRRPTLS